MASQVTLPVRPARERVLAAALDLFAEHGVTGTSLQMIADRMGVTKAAVYHKFQSKDDIVLALIDPALDRLARIADAAEREPTRNRRLATALDGVVDLVVTNRRLAAILRFDPAVGRLVRAHPTWPAFQRLHRLLTGPDPDPATSVAVAMVSGGLMIACLDPALAAFTENDLRRHLLDASQRFLRQTR